MIVEIEILDNRIQTPFDKPIYFDLKQGTHRRPKPGGGFQWTENFAHYSQMAQIAQMIVDGTASNEMQQTLSVRPVAASESLVW
jgi:hypothetical protein